MSKLPLQARELVGKQASSLRATRLPKGRTGLKGQNWPGNAAPQKKLQKLLNRSARSRDHRTLGRLHAQKSASERSAGMC
ncbi:hypothetical protein [Dinoroseobacter sp. S375]|uniref:hypothetical protein n=1 Tax=Dinoroseobacter sp. S375 TaxID=3415136 RepID=UPI003C7BA53B